LLLQASYTVRSELQLMEQLNYNLLFRWFVGLSADDPVWDVALRARAGFHGLMCGVEIRERLAYPPFNGESARALTLLHAPHREGSFSRCRIILDSVDSLTSKPYSRCDLANDCGLAEHRLRTLELFATVARLATPVGARIPIGLCMRNASALRFLRCLRLCLRRRGHERDQRVADSRATTKDGACAVRGNGSSTTSLATVLSELPRERPEAVGRTPGLR
jgi:hypothetical protein